ncbi:MAG: cyclic-di-AMP receptor [Clostridium sp.]
MKLIIAIVHDDDASHVIGELNKADYQVTKLATTGGFLKAGNTTILTGVEDEQVPDVKKIIKDVCKTRKATIAPPTSVVGGGGMYIPSPVEVTIGGATIFVLNVDEFEKA